LIQSVLEELYARGSRGIRLGLDGMREACAKLGHPERAFECVHIAGTNGKGSTSAIVESVARAAGKRTGLYTSPHLCRFAERIRINGDAITDAELARVLRIALDAAPELTFFEIATLAAFLAFRDARVDFAVLEVGLGGRLDATNVIETPRACAITSIGFDHMNLLGNTLAEIATEKAGIAKPGVPLVLGALPEEALAAITQHATNVGAPLVHWPAVNEDPDGTHCFFFGLAGGLSGLFQSKNEQVARRIAHLAGFDDDACHTGLRTVVWPGRYEFVSTHAGAYLLDAAHNPEGATAFIDSINRDTIDAEVDGDTKGKRAWVQTARTMVYGALSDKAWSEVLGILAPRFPDRVYACPKGRAAADPHALARLHPGEVHSDVKDALRAARAIAGNGLVVVCGSVYLVGEARAHLLGLPMDPPIAL
jgi:dihydrofolate synthase / folylpolyglutamate synthase